MAGSSPLLSIVAPIYNMSPWLAQALESCLWQSCENIEVLVVDDGSTDNGREIADYYAALDSRIRVIAQVNSGVALARQRGQDEAAGDYITFLDTDDFLAPRAAELWLSAARQGADMVCGNALAFSERSGHVRRYFPHPPASGLHFDTAPRYWKSKVLWRWAFSLPMLRAAGLRHQPFKLGQDVLFMFEALLRAKSFAQTAPELYYFRQEHKSARAGLETLVNHGFAHFIEARRILLNPPQGPPRIKPLVKYLNENYWRDIQKAAPRLAGDNAHWEKKLVDLGFALFDGLDPQYFRSPCLTPEVKEKPAFLPLVEAMIAKDREAVKKILKGLRPEPGQQTAQTAPAESPASRLRALRHRVRALTSPAAWRVRRLLGRLRALAASRRGLPLPALDPEYRQGR